MVRIGFFAGVEYMGKIYFSASSHNGFYETDIYTKKTKFLAVFQKEKMSYVLHRMAFLYEHYVWYIPQYGKYIVKIDLETLEQTYFDVPNSEQTKGVLFIAGKKIDEKTICLLPRDNSNVLIIDMQSENIRVLQDVINDKEEKVIDGLVLDRNLYLFFLEKKYYARIVLDTGKRDDIFMSNMIQSVVQIENIVEILTQGSEKIISYSLEEKKVIDEFLLDGKNLYNGLVCVKDNIIALPFQASGFLVIDRMNSRIHEQIPIGVKLPSYANKSMLVDSKTEKIFTIGDVGGVVRYEEGRLQGFYVEIDVETFFDDLSKYLNSSSEWKCFADTICILGVDRLFGCEGMLQFMKYVECSYFDGCEMSGNAIWNRLKGGIEK